MSTTQAVIESITTHSYTSYAPINPVEQGKVDALAASMEADGWIGSPIVVDGDTAVTGSHRLAARLQAGLDTLPVVEMRDLCEACGISWDEVLEDRDYDLWTAAIEVGAMLPAEVISYLGYDAE